MQHFAMETESRDNKDPYFTILHFVTVLLTDRNLGTGANEKKVKKRRTWGTQDSCGTRVLYSWQCVLIYCYTRKL